MNQNVSRAERVVNLSIYVQWLNLVCQMVPDTQSAIFKYKDGIDDKYVSWPKANAPDAQLLESLTFAAQRHSLLTTYTAPLLTVVLPVAEDNSSVSSVLLALSIKVEPDAVEPVKRLVSWSVRWLSELLRMQQEQQQANFLAVSAELAERGSEHQVEKPPEKPPEKLSEQPSTHSVEEPKPSIKHKLAGLISIGLFRWGVAVLLLIALLFLPVSYQIPVDTVIEGKVQKSIVSPFDGFIKTAVLKAGDIVEKGHVIAELDDQQLKIEVIRLTSQYQEHEKGYRKALAGREYAQANVYQAKLKQAKAKLDQVKLQLEQTALKAPIAGMIIEGDLSRRLGAPVSSGDLLFKIAPLNQYRAMLRVQETDIRFIKEGQQGALKLAALPDSVFDISLSKASPLFFEEDNQIVYLAEADLPAVALELLRPGMEGIARVDVGHYSLGWVLTHHFIDWLRVAIWKLWL